MSSFRPVISWLLLSAVVQLGACKKNPNRSDAGSASATPSASDAPLATVAKPRALPRNMPAGPSFAVEPGSGLGPIRFGSTVATVERHMQTKCEELTEAHCRYITSGIELELTAGAVSGILIQRFERPVTGSPDKQWGMFTGGIPPNVMMMMVPEAVIEQLGKPQKTQTVTEENPNGTVRRDYYPGLELEYDRNRANNRLMLGQIRVVKAK